MDFLKHTVKQKLKELLRNTDVDALSKCLTIGCINRNIIG